MTDTPELLSTRLVRVGLAATKQEAQRLIMMGKVSVGGLVLRCIGDRVERTQVVEVVA